MQVDCHDLQWTHLDCVMHAIQVQSENVFTNPSAPPGKSQQYAKPERERRFLLAEVPVGEIERATKITDRSLSFLLSELMYSTNRSAG